MTTDDKARIIWAYMRQDMPLQPADAIFVLCSHDTRVAERAADLFTEGYGPWTIVSGGAGTVTGGMFDKPEAEVFKDILLSRGVPLDKIIVESKASNTGENIRFTYDLLQSQRRDFTSFILVTKPYMERRVCATFQKQWPDKSTEFAVTSPQLDYDDYMQGSAIDEDDVINIMVGDLQRIKEYPAMGFMTAQAIPREVWRAYRDLIAAGYDAHLITG